MTIKLQKISEIISKAYDINPKFAEDMNRTLEQYAEYYYGIFVKDWIKRNNEKTKKVDK